MRLPELTSLLDVLNLLTAPFSSLSRFVGSVEFEDFNVGGNE
jgi:hypothetical protein